MSIIGVGVDIERNDRFDPSERSDRLLRRLFTAAEIVYCRDQATPSRHFAARFAAKEAAIKALGTILPKTLLSHVEIYKEAGSPMPRVRLVNGAVLPPDVVLHLSLSHADQYSTAFVVAEKLSGQDG